MKILLCSVFTVVSAIAFGQAQQFTKPLQVSLTPGISTNGMNHGGFTNYFSINLTSGISYSNFAFELGLISNQNVKETRGLQLAGLVNTTGTNAFERLLPKEIERLQREGFEANLSGAQFSGLANIVLNNVFGWQTTGGINLAKGALFGFQLSGISNTVYRYSFGVQVAGVYNVSVESMDGVQVAGLFNITTGGLFGVQIAAFNHAGFIQGKNSFGNDDPTGVQIGIVNKASMMNGFQIGLINISGSMQGTQIGLINIYRNGRQPMTQDGTSIGLINIGSSVKVGAYTNELFLTNVEISTGTFKNSRMKEDRTTKDFQNALIYGWSPKFAGKKEQWALGYGLRKFHFNRSTLPGINRLRYISYGVDFLHVSYERKKLLKQLSLVTRPHVSVGSRIHPRNHIGFFFASLAFNYYMTDSENTIESAVGSSSRKYWPGFSAGFMIH
jgi:hypothetical protein